LDDKISLAKLVDAPVTKEARKKYRDKEDRSKDAKDFLTNLKSA
jgi:hypothetical protein